MPISFEFESFKKRANPPKDFTPEDITALTPEEIVEQLRTGKPSVPRDPEKLSVSSPNTTPLTPEQIVRRLGVKPPARRSLIESLIGSFGKVLGPSRLTQMRRALRTQ